MYVPSSSLLEELCREVDHGFFGYLGTTLQCVGETVVKKSHP